MYYTIYKITNQIDGKFYIGSHKTIDLDDNYMGSGKYLIAAQEKYGIENFKKEILFVFETAEEMYAKEAEIVNEDFLAIENTYNLKIGGFGGWDYVNNNPEKYLTEKRLSALMTNEERRIRWKEKWNNDYEFKEKQKQYARQAGLACLARHPNGTFFGKKHTSETKYKIAEKAKKNSLGEKNSQYGTIWITNGAECKKIKSTDVIPEGWKRGRHM